MKIEQFEDKSLSHYSYAVLSEDTAEIVLIDPTRDVSIYMDFARENGAKIIAIIETHPHADFVSGHLELYKRTGATIYCSKLLAAAYPHKSFDEGDIIEVGKVKLSSLNTPGHSPDSICILLQNDGKEAAVFTGDTLFIGDCGRPDLRENIGNITAKREELAKQMLHSLRDKLMKLGAVVWVYPAHGAGTLCGKALSDANRSTIGAEKISNWALQEMSENAFIQALTEDQPFVPKYFSYNVELNKDGAGNLLEAIENVNIRNPINSRQDAEELDSTVVVVDSRPAEKFRQGHLPNSINIMADGKFETWLGSIITPGEYFFLAAQTGVVLKELIMRAAKIGYEAFIKEGFVIENADKVSPEIDIEDFSDNEEKYTIIDLRNLLEVKEKPGFVSAINIPLPELRERLAEIPHKKPIVVHCAGGYRSAAGSSIVQQYLPKTTVYDLSTKIADYIN